MKYIGEILTIDVEDLEWKISHTAENIWDLNRINGATGLFTVRILSIKVSDASSYQVPFSTDSPQSGPKSQLAGTSLVTRWLRTWLPVQGLWVQPWSRKRPTCHGTARPVCTTTSVNSYCSHEAKGCLLLGRRAMTNLVNILKSRDITLLTKERILKAMVFLVVTYRCDS